MVWLTPKQKQSATNGNQSHGILPRLQSKGQNVANHANGGYRRVFSIYFEKVDQQKQAPQKAKTKYVFPRFFSSPLMAVMAVKPPRKIAAGPRYAPLHTRTKEGLGLHLQAVGWLGKRAVEITGKFQRIFEKCFTLTCKVGPRHQYWMGWNNFYKYLEPKWGPLFWLEFRPCFGGLTFKNRGQLGSRYL